MAASCITCCGSWRRRKRPDRLRTGRGHEPLSRLRERGWGEGRLRQRRCAPAFGSDARVHRCGCRGSRCSYRGAHADIRRAPAFGFARSRLAPLLPLHCGSCRSGAPPGFPPVISRDRDAQRMERRCRPLPPLSAPAALAPDRCRRPIGRYRRGGSPRPSDRGRRRGCRRRTVRRARRAWPPAPGRTPDGLRR